MHSATSHAQAQNLDNGPTYRGDALRLACERLGITLLHARPYDAPARGKMERFWRTLREGCLDHLGTMTQLHDVQARLLGFLDQHYHQAPHGGLFGQLPADLWATATTRSVDEPALAAALTTQARRRVRKDGTLDIDGKTWQLDQSFLAGALVTVAVDLTGTTAPVVEHDGRRYTLRPVDAIAAGKTRRKQPTPERETTVPFDPSARCSTSSSVARPATLRPRRTDMATPYLAHFALSEPPFSKEVPDGDLWLPTSKQAVVDSLFEALDERASVVLVGEPGVGKTCVLRALRHRIPAAGFRLTYCHNATLGRRDFYRQLCHAVGLSPAATAGSLFYALSRHVEERAAERVHPVFLLDSC